MTKTFDPTQLTSAFIDQDAQFLLQQAEINPEETLNHIDGSMRGLRDGEQSPEQIRWLEEQDKVIRRRIGWKQQNADLEILKGAYQGGDVFLVVGAGVSMAAGMPSWKNLVLEVLDYALDYGSSEHLKRVTENFRRSLKGSKEWVEDEIKKATDELYPATVDLREKILNVRDSLIESKQYSSKTLLDATQVVTEFFGDKFLQHLQGILYSRKLKRTKIHPAIARMVRPKENRNWPPTPRIFSIVTYNFDDLIEQAIREAGYGFTVHCSQNNEWVQNRGETGNLKSAIDIFHVHGIAPGGWIVDLRGIDLIFTTEQYVVQYGKSSNLVKSVHQSFFGNAPGLIIGSSLTDEYAIKELTDVYEKRPGWYNYVIMLLPEEHLQSAGKLSGEKLEELSSPYKKMGLRVIWINDHDEIPGILDIISGNENI